MCWSTALRIGQSLSAFLTVFALVALAPAAHAEEPRRIVVFRGEGWPQAAEVEKSLAAELGATFVPPSRSREASAELDVSYDAGARRVTVGYRKLGEPIARAVAVAADEDAKRVAVVLSGQLARGDGATSPAEAVQSAGNAGAAPPSAAARAEVTSPGTDDDARRLVGLEHILEERAKTPGRVPLGVSMVVAGAAVASSGVWLGTDDASAVLLGAGLGMSISGVLMLAVPKNDVARALEKVRAERQRHGADVVAHIEAVIDDRADRERSARKVASGIAIGIGVLSMGVGGAIIWSRPPEHNRETRGWGAALLAGGGVYSAMAIYSFATPGHLEHTRDLYRAAFPKPRPAVSLVPGFAPVRGGAVIGLTGQF